MQIEDEIQRAEKRMIAALERCRQQIAAISVDLQALRCRTEALSAEIHVDTKRWFLDKTIGNIPVLRVEERIDAIDQVCDDGLTMIYENDTPVARPRRLMPDAAPGSTFCWAGRYYMVTEIKDDLVFFELLEQRVF